MQFREYPINAGYQTELAEMPVGAEIVSVSKKTGNNQIFLTARIDEQESKMETRRFKCLKNNQSDKVPGFKLNYIGTVEMSGVLNHVHECTPSVESTPAAPAAPAAPVKEPAPAAPAGTKNDAKTETKVSSGGTTDPVGDLKLDKA